MQSRYYDPELGRFLNADAFAATGQGLLGNNMFAYCLNNPVSNSDPFGSLTVRQIHDEVLHEICFYNPDLIMTGTTIYYNGKDHKGKWGFCDLVNNKTGEVWELKHASNAPSCQKSAALNQLAGYTSGRLKYYKEMTLTAGTTKIPSGSFMRKDGNKTYFIWYWDSGDGILYYDYIVTRNRDYKKYIAVAGLTAEVALVVLLSIGLNTGTSGSSAGETVTAFGPFYEAA